MPNEGGGYRFQEDSLRRRLDDCPGAIFDLKLFPQPRGNDDLTFRSEPDGIGFRYHIHTKKYELIHKVRQL